MQSNIDETQICVTVKNSIITRIWVVNEYLYGKKK